MQCCAAAADLDHVGLRRHHVARRCRRAADQIPVDASVDADGACRRTRKRFPVCIEPDEVALDGVVVSAHVEDDTAVHDREPANHRAAAESVEAKNNARASVDPDEEHCVIANG